MVSRVANPAPAPADEIAQRHAVAPDAPLFVVLNVGSGKHDSAAVRATIEAALAGNGRPVTLLEVSEPSQLLQVASEAVAQADRTGGVVVAAGGDGTINTVAQATLGSSCFFGVLLARRQKRADYSVAWHCGAEPAWLALRGRIAVLPMLDWDQWRPRTRSASRSDGWN